VIKVPAIVIKDQTPKRILKHWGKGKWRETKETMFVPAEKICKEPDCNHIIPSPQSDLLLKLTANDKNRIRKYTKKGYCGDCKEEYG
jgi:hypothetical protein